MIGNTLLEFKFVTSFSALGNINLVPDLLCYKAGLPLKKSKAKGGMKGYANFFFWGGECAIHLPILKHSVYGHTKGVGGNMFWYNSGTNDLS